MRLKSAPSNVSKGEATPDVPPPVPEREPDVPPPHTPVPDVPITHPVPEEPPTRVLPHHPDPESGAAGDRAA